MIKLSLRKRMLLHNSYYNLTLFFLPPLIHPSYPCNHSHSATHPPHLPSMTTSLPDPITYILHATSIILAYVIILHLVLFTQTLIQLSTLILLPIKLPSSDHLGPLLCFLISVMLLIVRISDMFHLHYISVLSCLILIRTLYYT